MLHEGLRVGAKSLVQCVDKRFLSHPIVTALYVSAAGRAQNAVRVLNADNVGKILKFALTLARKPAPRHFKGHDGISRVA